MPWTELLEWGLWLGCWCLFGFVVVVAFRCVWKELHLGDTAEDRVELCLLWGLRIIIVAMGICAVIALAAPDLLLR